ncbi:ABC transporter permease [Mycolicibacterium sp.]|uniref:ABC transporter permease n=1 Tax=Mycolicibacterium sp. TaxID=2320850 RepID=UPI003D141879
MSSATEDTSRLGDAAPTATSGAPLAREVAVAPRRPRVGLRAKRTLVGAAALLAGAAIWQVYGLMQVNNLFIPTFLQAVGALFEQTLTAEFWQSYARTLVPFVFGWTTALALGIALGVAMGLMPRMSKAFMPYFAFLNALPVSALVPLVVIAFGINVTAGATLVFLFAIVDVVLTSSAGVRYVDKDLLEMARSFGMPPVRRFRRVIWPGAMPGVMAAVRVGTGRAIVGMVVMELLLVSTGVGKLITRYKDTFQSAELYAVVMSLGIFGLIMLGLTRALERRVLSWQPARKQS